MKKVYLLIILIIILVLGFLLIKSPLSEKYNQKALAFYKNNDYQSAEKYFAKALFWKRNNVDVLINYSKTLLNLDKDDEALKILEKLFEKSPGHAEYYALNGQILVKNKDYKEAIDQLNQAIENDSLLSHAYYYRGIAKANLNDLTGAADDYTKAQEIDKSNIDALKEGTSLYVKLANYEASIENYNKILELDPKNIDAFMQRGNFKMKIGDYNSAIADFSQVINLSPDNGNAYFERGKAYGQNNSFTEAAIDFEKSYSLKYKQPSSLYNSGLAWLRMQKADKAKKSLESCIKITQENEYIDDSYQLLGTLELMQNNYLKSITYFDKAIKTNPANLNSYYNRGLAYGYLKEYQKALDDLNFCIGKGKTDGETYFARGVQKINLLDEKGGCEDLSIAIKKGVEQAKETKQIYCK